MGREGCASATDEGHPPGARKGVGNERVGRGNRRGNGEMRKGVHQQPMKGALGVGRERGVHGHDEDVCMEKVKGVHHPRNEGYLGGQGEELRVRKVGRGGRGGVRGDGEISKGVHQQPIKGTWEGRARSVYGEGAEGREDRRAWGKKWQMLAVVYP